MRPAAAANPGRAPAYRALLLVCAAWIAFIWLWEPSYLTLTADDAFYYLQVARNLAAGLGPTFDGFEPTNGFHPLWQALLAGLVRLLPDNPAILMRAALTLQVAFVYLGIRLLSAALRLERGGLELAAALALCHFYFTKVLINGLESALLWLLIALTLFQWTRSAGARRGAELRRVARSGLLAGLATLARLEAALFAAPLLLFPWPQSADAPSRGARRWQLRLAAGVAWGLPVGGYLVWNLLCFGHWTPVSAAVKADIYLLPPRWPRWIAGGVTLALLAAAALAIYRLASAPDRRRLRALAPLFTYAGGSFVLFFVVAAGRPPIWYLVPQAMLLIVMAALVVERIPGPRLRAWVATGAGIAWLLWSATTWRARLDPASYDAYLAARRTGEWIRERTEPDAVAAGWACGIVAAHADRPVVNLDGLANSWRYKEQFLDRGRVQEFIDRERRADYLVQYFDLTELPLWLELGFRGVDLAPWRVARAECIESRSVASGRTRYLLYTVLQREAEPSLPLFSDWTPGAARLCPGRS